MKFLILALLPALAVGQLPGGITDTTVDPNSVPVVFAVKAANTYLTTMVGGSQHSYSLVEVVSARTQVVAGQNLWLTLHLTGDNYCNVTVWYRAWIQGDEGLQVTNGPVCYKHPSARALSGGISAARPLPLTATSQEETILLQALQFAACAFNDRVNNMFASVLGDTTGVTYTQQVTSGMTYRFSHVTMLSSHCRNQGCANTDLTACNVDVHGMTTSCSFTVQSQPWMTPAFTLSDAACVA